MTEGPYTRKVVSQFGPQRLWAMLRGKHGLPLGHDQKEDAPRCEPTCKEHRGHSYGRSTDGSEGQAQSSSRSAGRIGREGTGQEPERHQAQGYRQEGGKEPLGGKSVKVAARLRRYLTVAPIAVAGFVFPLALQSSASSTEVRASHYYGEGVMPSPAMRIAVVEPDPCYCPNRAANIPHVSPVQVRNAICPHPKEPIRASYFTQRSDDSPSKNILGGHRDGRVHWDELERYADLCGDGVFLPDVVELDIENIATSNLVAIDVRDMRGREIRTLRAGQHALNPFGRRVGGNPQPDLPNRSDSEGGGEQRDRVVDQPREPRADTILGAVLIGIVIALTWKGAVERDRRRNQRKGQ